MAKILGRLRVWHIRVETQTGGHFTACVEAPNEKSAREAAISQVRAKYMPNLVWARTELVAPYSK